jgi:hypothetical protein
MDQARMIARRLAAAGKPVSRRALRSGGVTGSNQALNALARMINTELAGMQAAGKPPQRQASFRASQDSIWPSHGGAPGIAAA